MTERSGTLKTTLVAGALTRGAVRSQLERAKFMGMDIDWRESKRWTESDFHIIIRGTESQLRSAEETIKGWAEGC